MLYRELPRHLEQVTDNNEICYVKDRHLWIFEDGDDGLDVCMVVGCSRGQSSPPHEISRLSTSTLSRGDIDLILERQAFDIAVEVVRKQHAKSVGVAIHRIRCMGRQV
jgi:hypothetical protein